MPPPSALYTQNSPFNPDRNSPKPASAASATSVSSVVKTPVIVCANLLPKSHILLRFQHRRSAVITRHSPLTTRHFLLSPLFATHPSFAPVSPLFATHFQKNMCVRRRTCSAFSFSLRRYLVASLLLYVVTSFLIASSLHLSQGVPL